jgi:FLYWCH zinc finger domain
MTRTQRDKEKLYLNSYPMRKEKMSRTVPNRAFWVCGPQKRSPTGEFCRGRARRDGDGPLVETQPHSAWCHRPDPLDEQVSILLLYFLQRWLIALRPLEGGLHSTSSRECGDGRHDAKREGSRSGSTRLSCSSAAATPHPCQPISEDSLQERSTQFLVERQEGRTPSHSVPARIYHYQHRREVPHIRLATPLPR